MPSIVISDLVEARPEIAETRFKFRRALRALGVTNVAADEFWRPNFNDRPNFDLEDAVTWMQDNPRYALLTEKTFKNRLLKEEGATQMVANAAWHDSRVRRVRLHFRTTQTRILRAQVPQLGLYILAPPGFWQIDVFFMETQGGEDSRYKLLALVEIYSRKAYVEPMPDGTDEEIVNALTHLRNKVIASHGLFLGLVGDMDFSHAPIKQFAEDHHIILRTVNATSSHNAPKDRAGDPLGIINAFARTLKHFLRVYLINHAETDWVRALPHVMDFYNTV